MLSAISPGSLDPDDPMSLMLEAAIRTSAHLTVVLTTVGTMRQKMETWSQEGYLGRAEEEFTKMCLRGALSSGKKVRASFGNVLHDWILRRCAPITAASEHMQTGSIDPLLFSMNIPPGSNLSSEMYLSWLSGEISLLELIGNEVCYKQHTAALEGGEWLGRRLPIPPRRLPEYIFVCTSKDQANLFRKS